MKKRRQRFGSCSSQQGRHGSVDIRKKKVKKKYINKMVHIGLIYTRVKKADIDPVYTRIKTVDKGPVCSGIKKLNINLVYTRAKESRQ